MAYFEDYKRWRIEPGVVDQEGQYLLRIVDIKQGTIERTNERYTQVDCEILYKNNPHVSIFLTEGRNFNGNLTAFIDTFGIQNVQDFNSWKGKTGYVQILLRVKDGYKNMVPRWILGNDGFVIPDVKKAADYYTVDAAGKTVPKKAVQQMPGQVQQVAQAFGGSVTDGDGNEYGNYPFC